MDIYTDGASSNNQSATLREGGSAFIILPTQGEPLLYNIYEKGATNNQMELKAFEYALVTLLEMNIKNIALVLHTDSEYVIGCFSGNKIKKNRTIIDSINSHICEGQFILSYNHVDGHSGHQWNELCDTYAKRAIKDKNTSIRKHKVPDDLINIK